MTDVVLGLRYMHQRTNRTIGVRLESINPVRRLYQWLTSWVSRLSESCIRRPTREPWLDQANLVPTSANNVSSWCPEIARWREMCLRGRNVCWGKNNKKSTKWQGAGTMGQESYTIKAAGRIVKLDRPKRDQNSFEGGTCLLTWALTSWPSRKTLCLRLPLIKYFCFLKNVADSWPLVPTKWTSSSKAADKVLLLVKEPWLLAKQPHQTMDFVYKWRWGRPFGHLPSAPCHGLWTQGTQLPKRPSYYKPNWSKFQQDR